MIALYHELPDTVPTPGPLRQPFDFAQSRVQDRLSQEGIELTIDNSRAPLAGAAAPPDHLLMQRQIPAGPAWRAETSAQRAKPGAGAS